jgi:formylglycine-generating enzyme required for sulfatase activity
LAKAYDEKGNFLDKNGNITTDPDRTEGYRLPTEAEWEYAAKGGNKSNGYKYSGSNNPDDVAWYGEFFITGTAHEVGTKQPNELGIYDMSGNVSEWCNDEDSYYTSSSDQINPYVFPKVTSEKNFSDYTRRRLAL